MGRVQIKFRGSERKKVQSKMGCWHHRVPKRKRSSGEGQVGKGWKRLEGQHHPTHKLHTPIPEDLASAHCWPRNPSVVQVRMTEEGARSHPQGLESASGVS